MAPFLGGTDTPSDSSYDYVEKLANRSFVPAAEEVRNEDIAVIGMACRLPGGIASPEDLWRSILEKKIASGELPSLRWEPYYRRDPRNPRVLNDTTQRGYFLDNLEDFDSTFFGISPKEAVLMDPQQRLSLEVTWEALENAGIPPQNLSGSNTACYMGVNSDDYSKLLLEDIPGIEAWMGIGTAYCGVPNRISYLLDLRGPSTAVDAACASSLVAIHHGRQSLVTKETDLAIVGGVNAICGPGLTRVLDKAGAISKDGTCRSFDNEANGYGRGEGAAIIILKRLGDAVRDSDRILAVLKGSSVGQDGRTNGIMAPNGSAQEAVAQTALGNIDPLSIQYVEAHATSTSVGDPVEITAMSHVYGQGRPATAPCYVGSVKPNVGHLEAGAGAVGFIKAVMALRHGIIPPQANLKTLNKKIAWDTAGINIPFEAIDWPAVQGPRRAAICSYGYGGTVSHAVIEEAPAGGSVHFETELDLPTVLLLSAPQEKRIRGEATTLGEWMASIGSSVSIASVATTLATRRGHHDFRAGILAESREEGLELLQSFAKGSGSGSIITSRTMNKEEAGVVWLFSGHGAHWPHMGQELLAKEPVFRDVIENIDCIITAEADFSAIQALSTGDFDSSDKVQILTFAVQIGLAALLESKGARPSAIIGHSVGEIAAAVASGALTPEEGATVVCKRAVLYRQVIGKGAMALINIPFQQASQMLQGRRDIWAAIDSSPSSCVVSGTVVAVDEFSILCEDQGVKVLKVNSDIAFHTPLLTPLAEPLMQALAEISPREPALPLYSTAMENPRQQALRDANYWTHNMIMPVLLTSAVRAVMEDGHRLFLEVSSHPIISHSVNETLMDMDVEDFMVLPTILRNKPVRAQILKALVSLWAKGASINWNLFFKGIKWAKEIPKTQWQHRSFWKAIETGAMTADILHDADAHTLLGQCVPIADEEKTIFTTKLDDNTKPFPGSHPLHGTEIIPAAVLFNTFLSATGSQTLSNVHLRVPVAISAPRDIQVLVQRESVRLMSRLVQGNEDAEADRGASWLTHTTAVCNDGEGLPTPAFGEDINIASVRSRIGAELKSSFSIDYLAGVGVPLMGFPWTVTHHFGNTKEMLARVDIFPSTAAGGRLPWKPESWAPAFDAATSIGSTLFYETPRLRMPAHVANISIRAGAVPPKIAYIYVQEASGSDLALHVTIADESGKALAKFNNMRFSEIEGAPGASGSMKGLIHQVAWSPARLVETPTPLDHVIIVGSEGHYLLKEYKRQLSKRCIKSTCVSTANALSDVLCEGTSEGTIVVYLPEETDSVEEIPDATNKFCGELLEIIKRVTASQAKTRVYAVTDSALAGGSPAALAQSPLVGLSRIIASEQPSNWGALIDVDTVDFPFQAVKYVAGADVIKLEDSIARVARLRPLPKAKQPSGCGVKPRPESTYLISGGLGSLGLEVAAYLAKCGARRIVLLSRRAMPPRKEWDSLSDSMVETIGKIKTLEETGISIHSIAIDLSAANAATILAGKLEALDLPPVRGVVHAAGVLEDQLVLSTTPGAFARVLAPKINGTLALHVAFPPGTLDFFALFSSCGQLFGFPGQASYASGNAFLDSLAAHRRQLGDNAVAFQWTSWRGVGGMGDNEFVEAELDSRGITSITRAEAFRAWEEVAERDVSHAAVLRARILEQGEELPHPILEDIAVRRATNQSEGNAKASVEAEGNAKTDPPPPGPERNAFLTTAIAGCIASVLQLAGADEVDPKAALADLGMDSVMTVAFRKQLQQTLKVKVPPTLVWGHPTVSHLVKWFGEQLGA